MLVTTDYLQPDDDIDQVLREHGHETIHRPTAGPRRTDEALSQFVGIHCAIMASEPVNAESWIAQHISR